MLDLQINPRGIEDEYLKCLNLCFPGWGDQRTFAWQFRRKNACPTPDLFVFRESNRLVAGSAVTYRRVTLANRQEIEVGIMTGSWTLPQFRGRGYFAEVIKASLRRAAEKGSALLLAFVTEDNASFRQLVKSGAALFSTSYFFSTPQTTPGQTVCRFSATTKSDAMVAMLFKRLAESGENSCRFAYASPRDFESQFIVRPGATEIFSDGQSNFGLIESREDTDILQLLITANDDESSIAGCLAGFLNRALERKRKLFVFSSKSSLTKACAGLGLGHKAGRLTALVANESRLRSALGVTDGLKLSEASLLAQPANPWFLGHWSIAGGDRA